MSDSNAPYIDFEPGGLIKAEDFIAMQNKIKQDIADQVAVATETIINGRVKEADNANKFNQQSAQQWQQHLGENYAPLHHDHEGQSVYRRYFAKLKHREEARYFKHDFKQNPLVDVYQLDNVYVDNSQGVPKANQFFVYYGQEESELGQRLTVNVDGERFTQGISLEQALKEWDVIYKPTQNLMDVLNELWKGFTRKFGASFEHANSPIIKEKCIQKLSMADMKEDGIWDDITVAFRPFKRLCCISERSLAGPAGETNIGVDLSVIHVNNNIAGVRVPEDQFQYDGNIQELNLMIIMRG